MFSPKRHPLGTGIAISILALMFLVIAAIEKWSFLELGAHWLAVAILPLLVGLLVGGYISSFKGFGIEFEAAVKRVVAEKEVAEEAESDEGGEESLGMATPSPDQTSYCGRLADRASRRANKACCVRPGLTYGL